MDFLTLFFIVFTLFIIIAFSWYIGLPNCPECQKKVFESPELLDKKYTDTTRRKKDGSKDKRYNETGYWEKLKKWTCKCGYSWEKWVGGTTGFREDGSVIQNEEIADAKAKLDTHKEEMKSKLIKQYGSLDKIPPYLKTSLKDILDL